jgi:hypothetical protein
MIAETSPRYRNIAFSNGMRVSRSRLGSARFTHDQLCVQNNGSPRPIRILQPLNGMEQWVGVRAMQTVI